MEARQQTRKGLLSNTRFYWTKSDQDCLENGRRCVIADKIRYFPSSLEAKKIICNIIKKDTRNKTCFVKSPQKTDTAAQAIKDYLYKSTTQQEMQTSDKFSDFVNNGNGNIDQLIRDVFCIHVKEAITNIIHEARNYLKNEVCIYLNQKDVLSTIKKELNKRPFSLTDNEREVSINLTLSFLKNSKTKGYIIKEVMGGYIFGEDYISLKKYNTEMKKAILDRICYYIDNVIISNNYVKYLQ